MSRIWSPETLGPRPPCKMSTLETGFSLPTFIFRIFFFCSRVTSVAFVLQDGWVGFKAVILKKRLTATDFYNGYLHRVLRPRGAAAATFISPPRGGLTATSPKRRRPSNASDTSD